MSLCFVVVGYSLNFSAFAALELVCLAERESSLMKCTWALIGSLLGPLSYIMGAVFGLGALVKPLRGSVEVTLENSVDYVWVSTTGFDFL